MPPKPKKSSAPVIATIRVTISDINPPIWRRLQVPATIKLPKLHLVLQAAFGWENSHLHEFVVGKKRYGPPVNEEYKVTDESKVTLSELAPSVGGEFSYVYDLGDYWKHLVEIEAITRPEPKNLYPKCIDGKRAAPPEDSGGPPGYAMKLEALADERHPEHEEILGWVGAAFDPEQFDVHSVNVAIGAAR